MTTNGMTTTTPKTELRTIGQDNPDLLPIALSPRTVSMIKRLEVALQRDDHPLKFMISARSAASSSERQMLELRRMELERANAAAPMKNLRVALQTLLGGFPTASGAVDDARKTVDTYLLALDGQPYYAVREAVKRFLKGKVERKEHSFAPKAPELVREVERIATTYRAEQYQIGLILDARIEPEPDEGMRKGAVERWEQIKADMLAGNAPQPTQEG